MFDSPELSPTSEYSPKSRSDGIARRVIVASCLVANRPTRPNVMNMPGSALTWTWLAFGATISVLLALDLYVHRGARADSQKAAIAWSAVWVLAGLAFNLGVWLLLGSHAAQEYLAAYLIEKSLSVDNLFVFLIKFRSLKIPHESQRT